MIPTSKKAELSDTIQGKLFFIMGSGRNGSTLLARILNNHTKIFLPPEQFALPYTIQDWYLPFKNKWTKYSHYQLRRYFENNQNWELGQEDFKSISSKLNMLGIKLRSPRSLYREVLMYYALRYKKNYLLGDHSPLSTIYFKFIYSEFFADKFIFLIRHPFDVVLSYSKLTDNPASDPSFACWKWNNSVKAYDYMKDKGCQVILIKYEDLVTETEHILYGVLRFLNLEKEELNDNSNESKDPLGVKNLQFHQRLYNPIDSNSINKWKSNLNKSTITKILPLVSENARRFGYELI